jgi:hypothetical protein
MPTKRKIQTPIGERFGSLTVLSEAPDLVYTNKVVRACEVQCDCGTIKVVQLFALLNGVTNSCRCYATSLKIKEQERELQLEAEREIERNRPTNCLKKRIRRIELMLCTGALPKHKQTMYTIKLFKLTDQLLCLSETKWI